MKHWLLILMLGFLTQIEWKPKTVIAPSEPIDFVVVPMEITLREAFPKEMIEAMHGPYHGCLQWFVNQNWEAWREKDPQRWDTSPADEYTPGEVERTWWVCDIHPKHLEYDIDNDGDVDLEDFALFANSRSQ